MTALLETPTDTYPIVEHLSCGCVLEQPFKEATPTRKPCGIHTAEGACAVCPDGHESCSRCGLSDGRHAWSCR